MRGTVKWFNESKGFGFIIPENSGNVEVSEDVFVHYSTIKTDKKFKTLTEGQLVEYEAESGAKGMQATVCTPIGN